MTVVISNVIAIHDPSLELRQWVKKNLEFDNPDFHKKRRMGLYIGKTPKKIILYIESGTSVVLPYGVLSKIEDLIVGATIFEMFKIPTVVNYDCDIPLRDYQEEAVKIMLDAGSGILQSPAGSGKTQMGIALVNEIGTKALWITHTKDLLNQSKTRAEQYMDKSLIGTITEGKVNIGEGITFATVQTLSNLNLQLYRNEWDCIIVDECHRVAGTVTSVTQFSKVLEILVAKHKYGLSATVHRSDGLIECAFALIGEVRYVVSDYSVEAFTTRVTIKTRSTGIGLSDESLNTDGTLNYASMISYLCNSYERNKVIANDLVDNKEHSNLILSDRLNHLEALMALLPPELQRKSVYINGGMTSKKDKAKREQAIEQMRTGEKKYLFATYRLAKEGLDIPRLDRLFLTTPQKDYAVITQSVGRIERKHKDKTNAIAYDYVDNIRFLIKSYKKRCTIYRKNGCEIE